MLCGCHRHKPEQAAAARRQIQHDVLEGALKQALNRAEEGARDWRDQPQSEAYIRFQLLHAEVLAKKGQSKQAAAILGQLHTTDGDRMDVERRIKLASAVFWTSSPTAAHRELDRAIADARRNGWKDLLVQAEIVQLAMVPSDRLDEGIALSHEALQLADELHDQFARAALSSNVARLLIDVSQYDRAIPYLERADVAARGIGARLLDAVILGNLCACRYNLGDSDAAVPACNEAIALEERMDAGSLLTFAYGYSGNIYFFKHDLPRAVANFKRALDLGLRLGSLNRLSHWAGSLTGAYVELHEWDQAAKMNQQARELALKTEDSSAVPYLDLNAADIEAGRGNRAQALQLYSRLVSHAPPSVQWDANAGMAKIYAAQGDQREARTYFERAIAAIETQREPLQADYKITFLSDLIHFYQDYVNLLIDQGDTAKALAVADSSRARLLGERLAAVDPVPARKALDFAAVAKASGVVLLSYWIAPRRSVVWAISPTGEQRMIELSSDAATIRRLVDSYTGVVQEGVRDPRSEGSDAGSALYRILVQPVAQLIPAGAHVIVVPDGPLADLNFETLLVPGPQPKYWIEDVTISVAPSLGVLAERPDPRQRGHGLLLIGSPKPAPPYRALPFAEREMASIRDRLPPLAMFSGPDATPSAYRGSRPEQFAFIHFSAHAEANRERPLDSAVILSPVGDEYKLYARDVFTSPLKADLVTVSACHSAGAKDYPGEGRVGFAWAFLHAGAKSVIAGLWDVDDNSTAQLMDQLYAGLAEGQRPDQALRQAKLKLLNSTGPFRKPYYWAPFELYRRVP